MNDIKYKFNIDSLTLKMCCPTNLFNKLALFPSEVPELRDGYEVTVIEKDSEYNPEIIYLHLTVRDDKTIGVIKCSKHEQEALLYIDKEIFYHPLQETHKPEEEVTLWEITEYILPDVGFNLETVTIENMRIVRDSQWNTIEEIESLTEKQGFIPVIFGKESENCHLVDYYYFCEDGDQYSTARKQRKKKACVLTNMVGSLKLRVFCLSDIIKDLTNEEFINVYNDFPKCKDKKVYRTEINFNEYQFQQYFRSECLEYDGYYTLCNFFSPINIKDLFDFLSCRILYFQEQGKNEIISI